MTSRTTRTRAWLLAICGLTTFIGPDVIVAAEQCTTAFRLPIVLRLATAVVAAPTTPTAAFLIGDLSPGLRIVDARSGRLLWTTGAAGAYTQLFAGMTAGFTSSLAVIDTDGDGAHDRIYAGDLRGRLWRFDIDTRGPPSSWVAGGVFANLSDAAPGGSPGRGFLAAPDLTLITRAGTRPWLSVALGTANTAPGNLNRFYVLRDRAPFVRWTQQQYDRWTPLVDGDLRLAEGARIDISQPAGAGFFINLGARQVVAPALTVNGTTYYTSVATSASLLPSCNSPMSPAPVAVDAGSISAVDGSLNAVILDAGTIRSAPGESAVTLVRDENSPGGFVCQVAGHTLPGCAIDSALHRSFWRREDAD